MEPPPEGHQEGWQSHDDQPAAPPPSSSGPSLHGAYFAYGPDSSGGEEEEDYTVEGTTIRVMWDEGAGPLWAGGELREEPEWLRRALGLSEPLIADLLSWRDDMTALHHSRPGADHEQARQLDGRGDQLAQRLQAEVGGRFKVRYHP